VTAAHAIQLAMFCKLPGSHITYYERVTLRNDKTSFTWLNVIINSREHARLTRFYCISTDWQQLAFSSVLFQCKYWEAVTAVLPLSRALLTYHNINDRSSTCHSLYHDQKSLNPSLSTLLHSPMALNNGWKTENINMLRRLSIFMFSVCQPCLSLLSARGLCSKVLRDGLRLFWP